MLKNLRALRLQSGVTQREPAEAIGVSRQSINKYENHNIEPDIETMKRLTDFFQTGIDYPVGHTLAAPGLTAEEARLLLPYRRLSSKQQSCVLQILRSYLD